MESFAKLVDTLYFTNSNLAKSAILRKYLRDTPDPDRGWAIAAIAGTLNFDLFKRKIIKDLISERVDPILFDLSYDYVGEMSETVAHLWPSSEESASNTTKPLPQLSELVKLFKDSNKQDIKAVLIDLLDRMTAPQRWALIKLGTRGLRIGVSARFLKKVLSEYASEFPHHAPEHHKTEISQAQQKKLGKAALVEEIERLWHGLEPPYTDLLSWLEGVGAKPDVTKKITFQPLMLAHPISDNELHTITPDKWQAEWKYDGIRAQLVCRENGKKLFSRTGDEISASFPDFLDCIDETRIQGVFDGELLAIHDGKIASFNQLQQRLNKKRPSKKLMQEIPVGMMLYDVLSIADADLREQSLWQRTKRLREYIEASAPAQLQISPKVNFTDHKSLQGLRKKANEIDNGYVEGLMLKRTESCYIAGRPKGQWYKWKREPKVIDAVMMYAQRGHGKRSSFYSDFTFGCWKDNKLLPVGKAYSGFTDEELKKLDRWVRSNTLGRFGPVKEVNKTLVFELAFDSVHYSKRHKSGLALRFPRVHRIRWDKPADEADTLSNLQAMIIDKIQK